MFPGATQGWYRLLVCSLGQYFNSFFTQHRGRTKEIKRGKFLLLDQFSFQLVGVASLEVSTYSSLIIFQIEEAGTWFKARCVEEKFR